MGVPKEVMGDVVIDVARKKQGCVRSENISAERFFTNQFDQTAALREICSGGYPPRDNP